jgi:prepilin-type N-terminal cleavage/methylation domain-containing protein
VRTRGFTLPELLIALTVAATLLTMSWTGLRSFREASALRAATRQVVAELTLARRLAVNRRETIRFKAAGDDLALTAEDGGVLARLALAGPDALPVDSLRVRPATLRFNPRGQAAPGSVYLYRGRRSIRIVCNFLGRLRIETVRWIP